MTRRGSSRAEEPGRGARRVRWTRRAQNDLADIVMFIAADDPDAALRWRKVLVDAASAAGHMPYAGRAVPEVRRPDIREVIKGNYRLVYAVRPDRIDVLAVVEGHRLLPRGVDVPDDD